MAEIDNVRTLEDLISVVRKLYFNMDKISENYYNIFINPVPMTVELERYDELGILRKIPIKNRASESNANLHGYGNPNGAVDANIGVFYIDLADNNKLYYKTQDSSNQGWVEVYSADNAGDFLTKNGSAAQLTNLNVDRVTDGILSVTHGGTGATNISGLVKANGNSAAYSAAVAGKDYIDPDNLVGMIAYFKKNETRDNWLLCDGTSFPEMETMYPKLYEYLGGNTLPDLKDRFIRSWTNETGVDHGAPGAMFNDSLKSHTHNVTNTSEITTSLAGAHTHNRGTMNITGRVGVIAAGSQSGAFYSSGTAGEIEDSSGDPDPVVYFDASRNWTGSTSEVSDHAHTFSASSITLSSTGDSGENYPKHIVLVPMIYAGRKVS